MRLPDLPIEYLKSLLRYNRRTGIFHWKVTRGGSAVAGSVAGTLRSDGYIKIKIDGKRYQASRLAFAICHGYWPTDDVDHKNGVRSNNRFRNLRPATRKQNVQNAALRKDNTTGYTGVKATRSGKYEARIRFRGRLLSLGFYTTPEAASDRYLAAKRKLHEFAPELRSNHLTGSNPKE